MIATHMTDSTTLCLSLSRVAHETKNVTTVGRHAMLERKGHGSGTIFRATDPAAYQTAHVWEILVQGGISLQKEIATSAVH